MADNECGKGKGYPQKLALEFHLNQKIDRSLGVLVHLNPFS